MLSSLPNFEPVLTSIYPKAYFVHLSPKIHLVFFQPLKLTGITPDKDQISILSKPLLGKEVSVLNQSP